MKQQEESDRERKSESEREKKKRRSNGSNKGAVRAKVRQEEIRGSCRGEQEMKKKKVRVEEDKTSVAI